MRGEERREGSERRGEQSRALKDETREERDGAEQRLRAHIS